LKNYFNIKVLPFLKKYCNLQVLPFLTMGLCGLGLALRIWLFSGGVDAKGLIILWHPANLLCWALPFLAVAVQWLCLWDGVPDMSYSALFPKSVSAAAGCVLGAAGIVLFCLKDIQTYPGTNYPEIVALVVGILSAAALLLSAFCRYKGLRPTPVLRAIPCLFFMLHIVCRHQVWSLEAQPQIYCFDIVLNVLLLLTCYCRAALDAKKPLRRRCLLLQQVTTVVCFMCVPGQDRFVYLALAGWLLLDTPVLISPRAMWRNQR